MFGSAIFEVAIGVMFSFLLLSLVASGLNEGVSSLIGIRAWTLERGMKKLLNDPDGSQIVRAIYAHPVVTGLAHPSLAQRLVSKVTRRPVASRPPYIPSHTFAMVLTEVLVGMVVPEQIGGRPTGIVEVGNAISLLPDHYDTIKRTLLTLIDEADGDIRSARSNIEQWFNDAMERVSGWYKRTSQAITAGMGILLCTAFNADAIMMSDMLYRNSIMRGALVAAATESVRTSANPSDAFGTLTSVVGSINSNSAIQVPFGWVSYAPGERVNIALEQRLLPSTLSGWITKLVGFAITLIAISMGAPFWFNLLNGVVRLRLDGEPPGRKSR